MVLKISSLAPYDFTSRTPGTRQSALSPNTAPPARNVKEQSLSATLKAKLGFYSSPNFVHPASGFAKTQQSAENVDVLTVWQSVTSDPGFKVSQFDPRPR